MTLSCNKIGCIAVSKLAPVSYDCLTVRQDYFYKLIRCKRVEIPTGRCVYAQLEGTPLKNRASRTLVRESV